MTTEQQHSLYEQDETAWLEQTSALVGQQRWSEIDCASLSEYLCDMAKRDRREVMSRLVTLLAHLLKWDHQPGQRTNSWRGTILTQHQELEDLLDSKTLRNHAEQVYERAYQKAVKQAAAETGLEEANFPAHPVWSLDQILTTDLTARG